MNEQNPPEPGAEPWCSNCDSDLSEQEEVFVVVSYLRVFDWPPAFCSEDCASEWANSEQQKDIRSREYDEVISETYLEGEE